MSGTPTPKSQAYCAIARAASAVAEPTSYRYPMCDKALITEEPKTFSQKAYVFPDKTRIKSAGYDYGFEIGGQTGECNFIGFLFWLFLGADAFLTDMHTITPDDTLQQYLNILMDEQGDIDPSGSAEVRRLIGAKIGSLKLDQKEKEYATLDYSGIACNAGTPAASLTPTAPTGDTNEPLAWDHLKTSAGGFIKVGLNGAAVAQDDEIKTFSFDFTRALVPFGVAVNSPQPTSIGSGTRGWSFQFEKEWPNTNALAQYLNFKAEHDFSFDLKWVVSTNWLRMQIFAAKCISSPVPEGGNGDEPRMGVWKFEPYRSGVNPVVQITTKDGSAGVYT